jgi:hypothetical protein
MTDHSPVRAIEMLLEMAVEQVPAGCSMDGILMRMLGIYRNQRQMAEIRQRLTDEPPAAEATLREAARQHARGFARGVDQATLLVAMAVELYPRDVSEASMTLLMPAAKARKLLDCLKSFERKLGSAPRKDAEQGKDGGE